MDFVHEIWLKVGKWKPEYIHIFEIKLGKKIFDLNMATKTNFVTLRNNAYLY